MATSETERSVEYVGFWARLLAFAIDCILLTLIIVPLLGWIYGWDNLLATRDTLGARPLEIVINWVLPFVATILFWYYRQATPGKMLVGARILDQNSLEPAPITHLVIRNLGYIPSTLFLGVGFLWIAFDRRKQAWHDKMAHTVVVKRRSLGAQ